MTHCEMIQAEEIQVIVGDSARDGPGGKQYCGLWSLTSKHFPFGAFKNSAAGLITDELRRKGGDIFEQVDESTCVLSREADETYPVDARAVYKVSDPYYVDHTLTFRDRKDTRVPGYGYRESAWCSYMNCPPDPRVRFLSEGQWVAYMSPRHGLQSNIAPAFVPAETLEPFPSENVTRRSFRWSRAPLRFDEPFYYGRLGKMVLIFIFDTPRWLRFYCSPTGGGPSLVLGQFCPAWDFEYVIPPDAYEVDKEFTFRMRLVYKQYVSDDDVLEEFRRTQDELGFEKVGDVT